MRTIENVLWTRHGSTGRMTSSRFFSSSAKGKPAETAMPWPRLAASLMASHDGKSRRRFGTMPRPVNAVSASARRRPSSVGIRSAIRIVQHNRRRESGRSGNDDLVFDQQFRLDLRRGHEAAGNADLSAMIAHGTDHSADVPGAKAAPHQRSFLPEVARPSGIR
jgi:hypothetical protein